MSYIIAGFRKFEQATPLIEWIETNPNYSLGEWFQHYGQESNNCYSTTSVIVHYDGPVYGMLFKLRWADRLYILEEVN